MSQQVLVKTTQNYPTYEEIINEFSLENKKKVIKEKNSFGYWMQTLADVQFLDLELSGLSKNYKINSTNYKVTFGKNENLEKVKKLVAHLDTVEGEQTFYSEMTDLFEDTNAYAFHNLYPYKGKYYPRLVRTILNAFQINKNHTILDPYNGCGTTTHECGLMGIKSIGVDINPIGNIISHLKNEMLFFKEEFFNLNEKQLQNIYNSLKDRKRIIEHEELYQLFLLIYFDTVDAFVRTTRYKKKGELGLFVEKYLYLKNCYFKLKKFLKEKKITYQKAKIKEGNVLDLKKAGIKDNSVDAVITSPPYYFSLDYVGKDKIAYDYLNEVKFFNRDMTIIKNEYLGMKVKENTGAKRLLEKKVITYFLDLEQSVKEMIRVTKQGGKIAIVIGDSSLNGNKLPTTDKTHQFCLKYGLKHIRTIFNPLLGQRNRAIRGESVLLYEKE